ncbi:hypothetical protein SPRG_09385 [Saprolegnia parasitica CBS 223.65]|uniref:Glucosidase 2 subunit beta n=1 Tax=Saprolegnia parasitica (strain CBS 223.65) TaxID=695850 RepID=A0A067C4I5_SAPPC|nr:hypothetical protein SPRG_09385 [Saprolegnia parasitica CBS 223.65]KDO25443.1 hypothetical protein SPRG_09385 [Saprolegnia parasitica CBS 223.65]|eukprot:XP_012203869.1 hypothetical protein SPRG_09385 [Saprolegnia parasitica CBS 223.65]
MTVRQTRRPLLLLLLVVCICCLLARPALASANGNDDAADDDDDDDWFGGADEIEVEVDDGMACLARLHASLLNDGYCDCPSADDELLTGACGSGEFTCATSAKVLPSAFVDDGVCDCCDGSDEPSSMGCVNTCDADASAVRQRLETVLTDVEAGVRAKATLIAGAGAARAQFATDVAHWATMANEVAAEMDAIQTHFKSSNAKPTHEDQQQFRYLQYLQQKAQYYQYVYGNLLETDFGDQDAFASLVGQCFEYTVNEKALKGGTSNTVARTYVMVLCPFLNVTQTEPAYHEWRLAQKQAQAGETHITPPTEREEQRPILLGVWANWTTDVPPRHVGLPHALYDEAPTPLEADPSPIRVQVYDHGERCGEAPRRVHVQMECASSNYVKFVEEGSLCVYSIGFATPAACSAAYVRHLQSVLSASARHDEL